jgi:transcriptional regulator with XRE-family HTH domain
MGVHKWSELTSKLSPERRERIRRNVETELLAMDLQELRQATGKTQVEVAALAEMTQSELSRLERRDDHRLSTLRKYVEALGGELEVTAVLGDKRIKLHGV